MTARAPEHHGSGCTAGPMSRTAGRPLEAACATYPMPAGSGRVYVACESDAMRRIRAHLLTDKTINREHVTTRGYWKLGRGPSRWRLRPGITSELVLMKMKTVTILALIALLPSTMVVAHRTPSRRGLR